MPVNGVVKDAAADVLSWSEHLPAVYQKGLAKPGEPLLALLHISEHLFSAIEGTIDGIDTYFDPSSAPAGSDSEGRDFLSWLATWVAWGLDEGWSEDKKRYFVRNAARIYRHRGTPDGLKFMLNQCLSEPIDNQPLDVEIEEWSWQDAMEIETHSTIGIDTILAERPDLNHCFKVIWSPRSREVDDALKRKMGVLINLEKPAHTRCYLELVFPEGETLPMIIGANSTIGFCYIGQEAGHDE